MTDSDSELADAFEEATATAERVHAEGTDDGLDGDAAETLRDPAERLADALSAASLEELLDVTGFEDAPDDVSPVDLPTVIRDADADAIVELRTLLQLADLGESWSDLSAEERAERVDRAVGDAPTADDGGVALEEYIDRLGHILGGDGTDGDEAAADEATADQADEASAEEATEGGTDDGDGSESTVEAVVDAATDAATGGDSGTEQDDSDSDADAEQSGDSDGEDDELLELEDHVNRLRQLVGDEGAADEADAAANAEDAEATDVDADAAEADAVDDSEDAADEERTEDTSTQSTAGSRARLSTVPSSRSDMGKSGRFSTARGKR